MLVFELLQLEKQKKIKGHTLSIKDGYCKK